MIMFFRQKSSFISAKRKHNNTSSGLSKLAADLGRYEKMLPIEGMLSDLFGTDIINLGVGYALI